MATLSEADQKAAEKIVSRYRALGTQARVDNAWLITYVEGAIEKMVAEGIAAGRTEAAQQRYANTRKLEDRIAELEAIVDSIPKDKDGAPLLPGTEHWIESGPCKWREVRIRMLSANGAVRFIGDTNGTWYAGSRLRSHVPAPSVPEPVLDAEGLPIVAGETYTLKGDGGKVCKVRVLSACNTYLVIEWPDTVATGSVAATSLYRGWGPTLRELRETLSDKSAAAGLGEWPQERVAAILYVADDTYRRYETGEGELSYSSVQILAALYQIDKAEIERAMQRTMFKIERH
jgi:hypothetical protein